MKIKQIKTKKGTFVPCLVYDGLNTTFDIYVSFDVHLMSRISGLSIREIYLSETDILID